MGLGERIVLQPDGRLAVYSIGFHEWLIFDATAKAVYEWCTRKSTLAERKRTETVLRLVLAGKPNDAYFDYPATWEEVMDHLTSHLTRELDDWRARGDWAD